MANTLGTIKKQVEMLIEDYGEDTPAVFDIFLAEDIKMLAENQGKTLDNQEIVNIVNKVEHNKDASIGLNWDSINAAMDNIFDYSLRFP
jgi:methionine synthase I (cobalamin-dependent)